MPPVEETLGFVEDVIETELDWLNAPPGPEKILSFVVLGLFPVALFGGPVEALLAPAGRVRGPHRRLLPPHAPRRREGRSLAKRLIHPTL